VPDNANPAQVINLSLGGGGACPPGDPQARAIATANALGAVVVVSAGNNDADAADYSPASCPGVVTVAATGITSKRAFYSNYGASVEIAAPGGGVYTDDDPATGTLAYDGFVWQALNNGSHDPVPNSTTYAGYAGTSQAAPHVSGTVALMQSARLALGMSLLTPAQVLGVLQVTAMAPAVAPDASRPIGAGIVDAYAAVADAVSDITTLVNGQSPPALSGAAGSVTMFKIHVPAGVRFLSIGTTGGVGNLSMYVRHDAPATATEHDYSSTHPGVAEHVLIRNPGEGTCYITLVGETAYRNVTIRARYFQPRR
jgi:serine protease